MAPDARKRVPTVAGGAIISKVHTNISTLTRNKGLLVSHFLERFLDRIVLPLFIIHVLDQYVEKVDFLSC